MYIYAPSYYKKFVCIADKCKNSCCIDWEIAIDGETYEKYRRIGGELTENITESDGCRCFELKDGRCPHLTDSGLCDIIINHGDGYLAEICREHPRFYNDVSGRREAGLGLVCEEAARIILTDGELFPYEVIGECTDTDTECAYLSFGERDAVISSVLDLEKPLPDKIRELESKYRVGVGIHSMEQWLDIFSELEILDGRWKSILDNAKKSEKMHNTEHLYPELSRALAYFIYRHVTPASSRDRMRASLGFALLGVSVIAYILERSESADTDALLSAARLYSSEIEYSEDNTAELIFEFEISLSDWREA